MDRALTSCSSTFLKELVEVAPSPSLVRRSLLPSMMVQLIRLTHTLAASKRCRHSTGLLTELKGSWNVIYSQYPAASINRVWSNLGFSITSILLNDKIMSWFAFWSLNIFAIASKCFLLIIYHRVCLYKPFSQRLLHRNILRSMP